MLNYQRIHLNNFKYTNWYLFHTTSGASRSGPPSTYLNVVTVYILTVWEWFLEFVEPIKMVMTWVFFSYSWTFLRYTKKCSETKKRSFPKKCYKSSKSAHLVVSFCWAPPHVQTAGSPSIFATYADTITLCLGSRYLGSPQPTSFAAAASKSSNLLGWAELDTKAIEYPHLGGKCQ